MRFWQSILALSLLFCLACVPDVWAAPGNIIFGNDAASPASNSNTFPIQYGVVSPANISTATGNVANSSTTVTLTNASTVVLFKTDPAAAVCYVCPQGGTCSSTAGFRVEPGNGLKWTYQTATGTFTYIGASATGTYSVIGE